MQNKCIFKMILLKYFVKNGTGNIVFKKILNVVAKAFEWLLSES